MPNGNMIDTDTGQISNSNEFGVRMHDEAIARAAELDRQAKEMIRRAQSGGAILNPGQTGGSLSGHYGISTPFGTTLTTAQKQAQNPLYNPLYDPSSAEYQSNLVNGSKGYQPPSNTYQQPQKNIFDTAIPGFNQGSSPLSNNGTGSDVPTWKPPVQMPQQDQGQLFQNNNNQAGGLSVPSWKPPTTPDANAPYGQAPGMGTMNPIQQRNQPSRYQSPSSRYARNMNQF